MTRFVLPWRVFLVAPVLLVLIMPEPADSGLFGRCRRSIRRCQPVVVEQSACCQPTETKTELKSLGTCDGVVCPVKAVKVITGSNGKCIYKEYKCRVCKDNSLAYYDGSCNYKVPQHCLAQTCIARCIPRPVDPVPDPPPFDGGESDGGDEPAMLPPRYVAPAILAEGLPSEFTVKPGEGFRVRTEVVGELKTKGVIANIPVYDDQGNQKGSKLVKLDWLVDLNDPNSAIGSGYEIAQGKVTPGVEVTSKKVTDYVYSVNMRLQGEIRPYVVLLIRSQENDD